MKIIYLFILINVFANFNLNAQIGYFVRNGMKVLSKSSTEKSILKELESISQSRIKVTNEKAAYNFLESNSVIILDKNALRLGDTKAFLFRDGKYSIGQEFENYSKADVIIFNSSSEKETFIYMRDRDLINMDAVNPLKEYELALSIFKKKYSITNFEVSNSKFVHAVNDATARNILRKYNFIDISEMKGDITYAIMEFQKICKFPITGKLDIKIMKALNKLTINSQKAERLEVFYSRNHSNGDLSYAGSSATRFFIDKILQTNYLTPTYLTSSGKFMKKNNLEKGEIIKYLDFLATQKFIPNNRKLWTNLEVDKGLLKYQKINCLHLSGDLDDATIDMIKEEINVNMFSDSFDGAFLYKKKKYNNFSDIPFESSDNLSFERSITKEQADHLMKRGVKFVYNNSAYISQKNKSFKIIYLISENTSTVKELYQLDEDHANRLIEMSSCLLSNKTIVKVESFDEMLVKQNEIIKNNEVPILIFHNSIDKTNLGIFDPESNFITCNSFNIKPDAYLASTDFLDMQAIIEGINLSYHNNTLQDFYSDFTSNYYLNMEQKHQQTTLMYLGGGVVVGGGVFAIAFYNSKS
jgi:hypothetical protein